MSPARAPDRAGTSSSAHLSFARGGSRPASKWPTALRPGAAAPPPAPLHRFRLFCRRPLEQSGFDSIGSLHNLVDATHDGLHKRHIELHDISRGNTVGE